MPAHRFPPIPKTVGLSGSQMKAETTSVPGITTSPSPMNSASRCSTGCARCSVRFGADV